MKFRRFLAFVLTFILLLQTLPVLADDSIVASGIFFAELVDLSKGECGENLIWTLDNEGTLTISGSGKMYDWDDYVDVPWYSKQSEIKNVVLEDGVTSIGAFSFNDCTSLTSIIIPQSVTYIGSSAFTYCRSLESITIPQSVTSIGEYAFYCSTSLESIAIPESVTYIGGSAFSYCSSLESIIIPQSVTSIGFGAFMDCSSLESITIPESVTSIGNEAFHGYTSLTSITIPESVTSIGECAFMDCTSLESITIPESVTSIGIGAFIHCTSLESITIPESVTSIGGYAFSGCTSLTSITIPESIAIIYAEIFKGCTKLESITIPESVTRIGAFAFDGCVSLESITIPESVTSIGEYAFGGCTSLTSITIPESVTSIGYDAFYECTSLESITIPESVTSIGNEAFRGCTSLSTVYYAGSESQWQKIVIGASNEPLLNAKKIFGKQDESVSGTCGENLTWTLDNEGTLTISGSGKMYYRDAPWYSKRKDIKNVVLEDGVTSIGIRAFIHCSSLESITIPQSVTSIGFGAFTDCSSLESITIPESVTSIGNEAFYGCTSLTSITIPESVTSIGEYTFYYCSSLESITIPESVTSIGAYAFEGCTSLSTVYYAGSESQWKEIEIGDDNAPLLKANIIFAVKDKEETYTVNFTVIDAATGSPIKNATIRCGSGLVVTDANGKAQAKLALGKNDMSASATGYVPAYFSHTVTKSTNNVIVEMNKAPDNDQETCNHSYTKVSVTQPTCTKDGITTYKCTACGHVKTESVPALGHDYAKERTIDIEPTCTENGRSSRHCSRCTSTTDAVSIAPKGHTYGEWVVNKEPTCTDTGTSKCKCTACGHVKTERIPALGHDYAKEWTVDIQPTCTEKGSTSRHCSRCTSTTDRVSIEPKGHTYGEWEVVKVPDFTNDGLKSRKCTACGHAQSETITKPEYDMEVNKGHGAVYFTVVNAVTKEPVSGVSIACSGTTVKTDSQGKAYAVLPVGKQQLTVYANGYNTRNLNYTILNGENIIPVIGISNKPFIDVTFDHKEMTIDEIKNAGIDITAPANQHVWNYQLTFRFDHENYQFNIYWNKDHIPVKIDPVYPGGGYPGGGVPAPGYPGSGPTVVWPGTPGYPDIKPGTPPFIVIPPCDSDDAPTTIYPIREGYYLVVKGSVKWLKEMFDVYMIILNTSQTDTVEDCTATLALPDGISLAEMTADVGQQSLVQNVDYIGMGETKTVHWYIKGDKKGKYNLSATLDGKYMPFEEQFHYEYTTPNPLIVEAGSAMHMTIEAPGVAYLGKPYPVRLTIENVSDMPVYGMNHTITSVDQFKIVANANGTFTKTDYDTEGSGTITHDVFNPGEKIVIELTTDVLFNTDLVYKQLSQIKDGAQSVKTFKNMYDALIAAHTAAKDVAGAFDYMLYNTDESRYPGVFERFKQVHERLYNNCRILDARSAYIASEIRASEHYYVLDKFRTSNGQELPTMAELDACVSFVNKVIDDSQNLTYSEMRAFDKVKTVVTSIPLKFILKNVWVTTLEGSTTEIPCSFRIYNDNSMPGYFATEPVGRFVYDDFMDNFGELDMPNLYSNFDGLIPGSNRTHGGIIYAKPSDMIVVAAKSSGGKTNFRAWIEDQNGNVIPANTSLSLPDAQMMRTAATASLGCTNESSVLDNNVLSFTGPGYIKVQPADIENAVLVVEMSENGQTVCDKYTIQTVEDHVCSGNSWETVFLSVENDGYNARFCSTCETLLEVNIHGALNFSDVPKDSWYYNAVRYASINSLMNGTSDTTFSPEQGLTRAMFVTVLYRLAGSPTDGKHSFADVPDDAWYSDAVSWASANGIINGVSATEFAPDNNITREQMTAVVYRYSRYKNYGDETQADTAYSDKDNISDYAATSVKWCSANGIIKGNADGTFNPGAYSTRAQAATVFMRLLTTFD